MKKVISAIVNVLITVLLIVVMLFGVSTLKNGYTNFCGYTFVRVLSGSMSASGINRGDVKLIHASSEYHVGDIIAFYYPSADSSEIVLYHEIIEQTKEGFVTKGSSNQLPESNITPMDRIIGKQVNNGNYAILLSIPLRIAIIGIVYIAAMAYIISFWRYTFKHWHDSDNFKGRRNLRRFLTTMLIVTVCMTTLPVFSVTQNNCLIACTINFLATGWEHSNLLSEEFYQSAVDIADALSNPQSQTGQALQAAIDARRRNTDWIGNMDNNSQVTKNLDVVLDLDDTINYIIKIKSDGTYELYMTEVQYQNKTLYTRFGPVYKTVYKPTPDGKYVATITYVGTATVTFYDILGGQFQKSFNTDEFISQ